MTAYDLDDLIEYADAQVALFENCCGESGESCEPMRQIALRLRHAQQMDQTISNLRAQLAAAGRELAAMAREDGE